MNNNGRSIRILFGFLFILLSLVLLAFSGWVAHKHEQAAKYIQDVSNTKKCDEHLTNSGATLVKDQNELVANWVATDSIEESIVKSALSLTQCSAYKLTKYCAGEVCNGNAVSVTMVKP